MLRPLFWLAAAVLTYTYMIFPALVFVRAVIMRRPYRTAPAEPFVTLVIAAYNEAGAIGAKIANILALDYPPGRLEIIIASDGSDDGTDEIVQKYVEGRRLRLLSLPRRGKSEALNAAVASSHGDVLVFSDANSMFAPNALRKLLAPLADPEVGGVAGNQLYFRGRAASGTVVGERQYWSFDRLLKQAQSRAGHVTCATGAIYAIRRGLFQPIPYGLTDDFITSLRVIDQGYRLIFAQNAIAYEPVAPSSGAEFNRKVRVMTRGLRCAFAVPQLFDPRRHGFYAVQLFSHKVLMRTMAVPLFVLAGTGALLWRNGRLYRMATVAQALFYVFAGIGLAFGRDAPGRRRIFALPAYFCFVNAASLVATWNLLRRRRVDRWETGRPSAPIHASTVAAAARTPRSTPIDPAPWQVAR